MKTQSVPPNVGNFIQSLRDIGYTFEVAVADVLDNSISANSSHIQIHSVAQPELFFCMLDNGFGMTELDLIEAMRLSSKGPNDKRDVKDLGKFGLGLKTASFSQCKKLTVLSKKENKVAIKQWDLDYISEQNDWLLITPNIDDFNNTPLINEFNNLKNGTLVIWQKIDQIQNEDFSDNTDKVIKHLSLVFHRFLEARFNCLKITFNNSELKPFNPFHIEHNATQEKPEEVINIHNSKIMISPFVLPHHSKVSPQEWERYATEDGYIKSQGFYLYRAKRLLIYGTWWGMHRATDAHKLVRIKIDIPNDQDEYWGIDIKKSHAKPRADIKSRLKAIINKSTELGSRPYTGRGRKIKDKTTTKFWQTIPVDDNFRFGLNKEHPIYQKIKASLGENFDLLDAYLKGLEAYLPLEAIQAHLQQNPHDIKQESALSKDDIKSLVIKLKEQGLDDEYIASLLKTEIFKNNKELLE